MKVGDLVKYKFDNTCTGVLLETRDHLYRVKWFYDDIIEWMPSYSIELLSSSET